MVNWSELFFSPEIQDRLWFRVTRRFRNPLLAEEAFNDALARLSADGWALLRQFRGESSHGTYLFALFNHCLEDFVRARFGRHRPPAWLPRLGSLWLRIYQLLCLEGEEPEQVINLLSGGDSRPQEEVRKVVDTILGRVPDCGHEIVYVPLDDEGEGVEVSDHRYHPERLLIQQEWEQLLAAIREMMGHPGSDVFSRDSGPLAQALAAAVEGMALRDDERLILRMVFQDGLKISVVARRLGLPDHQVRRMCAAILQRFRAALVSAGVREQEIRDLLGV